MQRFMQLLGKSESPYSQIPYLPEYGPLDITDYKKFLEGTKAPFLEKWNYLKNIKDQPVKLEDNQCSLQDFKRLKLIGAGTFGQVYLVNNKKTGGFHAMKAVQKKTVVDLGQVNNTRTEKMVLQCSNCPFTLRLEYFFKDNSYLYFILPIIRGGELFQHLQRSGKLSESSAMFYVAQVILALEYLHYFDIIYRDLKPENILLDHTGYIKLTDFGFCKHLEKGRTYTICGTPDYLAPETLRSEGYGKAADWWAVGVLVYELTVGFAPFKEKSDSKRYYRIMSGNYRCPPFLSGDVTDLISNALQLDVTKRLGNMKNGVNDFKTHKWFKPLNWPTVASRKAKPPFIPDTEAEDDTKHFREYAYKSLKIADTLEYGKEFADF